VRIYIAGPLSSKEKEDRNPSKVVVDYIANLNIMCQIASEIRRLGYFPYVPGMDLMLGLVNGDWEEEDYRGIGMSFLEVCDAVYVIAGSWGVQKEIDRAKELGIPVFYNMNEMFYEKAPNV